MPILTTYRFLAKTENRAALEVLALGMTSKDQNVRNYSISCLLTRPESDGHHLVLDLLDSLDDSGYETIASNPSKLYNIIRDIFIRDKEESEKILAIIQRQAMYDALPTMLDAMCAAEGELRELLADNIRKMVTNFYAVLSQAGLSATARGNNDNIRTTMVKTLAKTVATFDKHERVEVIEAYLMIVKYTDSQLRDFLTHTGEAARAPILQTLLHCEAGGVLRLLFSFLDDPQMPAAISNILGSRCDQKFFEHIAKLATARLTKNFFEAVSLINKFTWLERAPEVLEPLPGLSQAGVARVLMASMANASDLLNTYKWILDNGKLEGRVTVAKGLGDLDLDPESDYGRRLLNIILEGLDDESHEVRAALIPLIRTKKIPGAFSVLIHLVDEEMDESERSALRFALPEFTYQAFSANFEKIAEEMRPFIGNMVRQIDADAMAGLEKELNGPSPVRRKRSLFVAESMGLLSEVEEQVLASLNDEDHMVRIAAAQVLAKMSSSPTWAALKDSMLDDKNASVRFAAEASLEAICDKMNSTEEDDTPSETFSAEQVEKAIKRDPNKDFILE